MSENAPFYFPSPVVGLSLKVAGRDLIIKIPKVEMNLLQEVFTRQVYSVPSFRSHSGPLTVVDVGANVGLFAVYASLLGPGTQVYCFEPAPATVELLRENLQFNPDARIFPFGLSNQDTLLPLNINAVSTECNSFKDLFDKSGVTVDVMVRDAGRVFDEQGLHHVDILKIDTEGCELEILESLGPRLVDVDYVLLEYHSEGDRRRIDLLLKDFALFGAASDRVGLGTLKYLNHRLCDSAKMTDVNCLTLQTGKQS